MIMVDKGREGEGANNLVIQWSFDCFASLCDFGLRSHFNFSPSLIQKRTACPILVDIGRYW